MPYRPSSVGAASDGSACLKGKDAAEIPGAVEHCCQGEGREGNYEETGEN